MVYFSLVKFDFVVLGLLERQCLPPAVPLWRLLFLSKAERAGVPQHCLDQRVRRPEAQGQDRQLHSNFLRSFHSDIAHLKNAQIQIKPY